MPKTVWVVMKTEPDGGLGAYTTLVKAFWNEEAAEKFAGESNFSEEAFENLESFDVVEIPVE